MSPFPRPQSLFALAAMVALAGCGGLVASDAPPLLTTQQIAARSEAISDTTRDARMTNELALRGARLRARARQLQWNGMSDEDRRLLHRRAEALRAQHI